MRCGVSSRGTRNDRPPRVTLAEQIAEVGREIGLRRRVYPERVRAGELSQTLADRQIACMEAAHATLKIIEKYQAAVRTAIAAERRPDRGETT